MTATKQILEVPALDVSLVGEAALVPLLYEAPSRAINFDYAATTPALQCVRDAIVAFLNWHGSVHRGAGFKSLVASQALDDAREAVGRFVGADPAEHVVIFGKNTTEALNKLASCLPFEDGDVVLCSTLEHHSNLLPWRFRATTDYIACDAPGRIDLDHLEQLLRRYAGRVRLVAVSGASNVTGALTPLADVARLTHAAGAELCVDAAQLAAHRPISMGRPNSPERIDYLALAGHKMYAPFGSGALIGNRATFNQGRPEYVGGGTATSVSLEAVTWSATPRRDEAGTPNVVGAVALAVAMAALTSIGLERIAEHEAALTAYALQQLGGIAGVRLYGDPSPYRASERLGILPFAVEGRDHQLVAAILSAEYGIAVRSGSFCAQPYVRTLLGQAQANVTCGGRTQPAGALGLVRASMGLGTTPADIDVLAEALEASASGTYRGSYVAGESGYHAEGWKIDPDAAFSLRSFCAAAGLEAPADPRLTGDRYV